MAKDFITELKPMLIMNRASSWESVGSNILSKINMTNAIKLFGFKALKQRSVINSLYRHILSLKD